MSTSIESAPAVEQEAALWPRVKWHPCGGVWAITPLTTILDPFVLRLRWLPEAAPKTTILLAVEATVGTAKKEMAASTAKRMCCGREKIIGEC
jgi:hypothetical protein